MGDLFFQHYASEYYDPVKAHEYYMQHRKLKGRQTSKLSDEGKKVWDYTKSNITAEKKVKTEETKTAHEKQIEAHRQQADGVKKNITDQLKKLNDILTQRSKSKRERTSKAVQAEIDKINAEKIPEGLSKEKRAKLAAEKKAKIAKLRGDAKAANAKDAEETKTERTKNSESAKEQRTQVATTLKGVVKATREAYKKAKADLDASYEDIYQAEFDKIAAEFPKQSKKRGRSK